MSTQGIFSALKRLKITRKKKLLSIRREMARKEKSLKKSLKKFQNIKECI